MQKRFPVLLVMAGPNGSGKSTITSKMDVIGDYVNADDIKRHLNCDDLTAAKIAESTREFLLKEGKDFTFETVLSTPRNLNLMERAKNNGYTVVCIYVLTCNPQINVERVLSRARNGGHDVPSEKVVARYKRAMALIPQLFKVCDELYVYDNSIDRSKGSAEPILRYKYGQLETLPNDVWSMDMLTKLMNGTFFQDESP